ncbi:MAG: type II toxin-antitoxin system VapB family antitoxin [Kiritimatiellae bacterium]|nr:type II toxin-antitoxin system VapB family antitoxin [Kiritimatiellia bacterium]
MRTTLEIPKTLIDEALRASHHKTKTAVIIAALEDLVRKKKIQKLKQYKGKVDLRIDLATLRKRP